MNRSLALTLLFNSRKKEKQARYGRGLRELKRRLGRITEGNPTNEAVVFLFEALGKASITRVNLFNLLHPATSLSPSQFRYGALLLCYMLSPFSGQAQTDSARLSASLISMEDAMWGVYPDELAKAKRIHEEVITLNCVSCAARSYRLLGRFYWANAEYPKGMEHFRKAVTLATRAKNNSVLAATYDLMGMTNYYQAYYDSGFYFFSNALAAHERDNNPEGMIQVLHRISLMYHRRGNFQKAIEYLFKEEQLKDKLPQSSHDVEALSMGTMMIDTLYYREEIADELKALKAYHEQGDRKSVQRTYHNLAKAYRQLKLHVTAARYFVMSSKVMKEVGLLPEWDWAAVDYRDAGMKDSAFYYHYLAKVDMPRNTQSLASYTVEALGHTHKFFNNPDSALLYYDSAFRWSYRLNARITYTGIRRSLVNINTALGKYNEAEKHLVAGLLLAKEIAMTHEMNLYLEGKQLFEKKGDFKRALSYAEQYRLLRDSLNRSETALNLTRMQAEFKTAKKAREVQELNQKNELHEAQIKTNNLQLALAGVLLLVLASLGGLYYLRYRQKQRLNAQLEKRNKEKEVLLHEIHHRVKNNLQVISSLINLKSKHVNTEANQVLQQINGRIFSMGLIHEKLYQRDDIHLIRLDEYLAEVGRYLLESFSNADRPIRLKLDCEQIEMDADTALTCCLITNEVITNSVKHAFANCPEPEISLALHSAGTDVLIRLADNGPGNGHADPQKSFGLRFVDQLVSSKLNGEWSVASRNGFEVNIKFPRNGKDRAGHR